MRPLLANVRPKLDVLQLRSKRKRAACIDNLQIWVKMVDACRFKIRFMQPGEAGRVAELISALQEYQKMKNTIRIPSKEDLERELQRRNKLGDTVANNRGTFIAVAVDTESSGQVPKIVGYLIYSQSYSVARGRYMFLNSFFLDAPYRALGLGTKFIKFMQLHCKLLGYNGTDVGVMKNNLLGQKFYKKFGAYLVDEDNEFYSSSV